jgi:hypothetical protein
MNTDQAIDIVSIIISAVLSVFGTTGLFLLIIFLAT